MEGTDRDIAEFTMLGHATFHIYELTIPLFVVLWLDAFDVSPAVLGTVVAVGYALIGVGALPSGILADRYGSTRLVVVSMLGMGGGFALISLAANIWLLAAALVLWGATASLYHPAGLSLITRGADKQGTVLAYHGVAGNVGTALGPLVAAIMLTVLDWRAVAALFVVPALVGVVAATRLEFDEMAAMAETVDDTGTVTQPAADGSGTGSGTAGDNRPIVDTPSTPSLREHVAAFTSESKLLFTGSFVLVFTIAMLAGTYYRGVFTFLPDVLAGLAVFESVEIAGETVNPSQYAYAGLLLIGAVGQYTGGKLSDTRSPERAIIVALAALVVVSILFPIGASAGLAATLAVCAALGFFVYMEAPIHQALIGKYVAADVHGLSFGYTYLGVFGIGAAGASIAGIALTYGGMGVLFAILAIFPAVALIIAISLLILA
ncbi:major facilitator superfamily protein [Natrialba chahannaoensis JCM 10990]|uniref:Major facilitator superfamily protein n=1 Tax=Natrialba chahannaoensis JCM 10990 TaxID=1227492 RepID=M0AQV1_9EURY|nr:MFS transporter [Natrialba chahannaoensis]ELZ01076.1 major facilitator superfamily protein [Natrialba chahannaoensis JCM 10990]